MKYIIGSGWWCADKAIDTRAELLGDDEIRGQKFHQLWYEAINKYTSPEKIIIVDSCSPTKPILNDKDEKLELVSLNVNGGHSTNHVGKFCGYTRAILLGLEYALQCEVDYYVYVEQDALIYGDGIIEHCISNMTKPYMFGGGEGTAGILQQSFFIIRRDAILSFKNKLNALAQTDNELSPENKFHIACSHGSANILAHIKQKSLTSKFYQRANWQCYKYLRNWEDLPIGFGRARPIDFGAPYFYFQHGCKDELNKYLALTGIEWSTND